MLDFIQSLHFGTKQEAIRYLIQHDRLNKGTQQAVELVYAPGVQKALDVFFNRLQLRNGTVIMRNKRGQLIVRNKQGRFRSAKGLGRYIKEFKAREKK